MAQQPGGFRREADAHGVTPALPEPAAPPAPDDLTQAVHFFCLAVAVYLLQPVSVVFALSTLRDLGFYAWYYTPEFVAVAFGAKGPAQQESLTRLQLWASAAAFPLWFGSAALLLARLSAAYRHALSVSLGRFARRDDSAGAKGFVAAVAANVLLGVAAWLVIAPVAFGVNYLLGWLHTHYLEFTPEE